MKESDWKVFTAIKDKAIEQYCTVALEETQSVISDHKKHVHERYLFLYKLLQNSNDKMALLFDGHSRSKAGIQLIAIRSEGLADEALLSKLSDEFRDKTDPEKHGW
tara:strand:+ start:2245 stop:2562 length:318 start_codon:yes stop_codon:yes gene_type:complete